MPTKLLEVIVTSVHEAIEAELGGADRLEIVRRLDLGGLTPDLAVVEQIVSSVSIPVRVMLREHAAMCIDRSQELEGLCIMANRLSHLPVQGFVLGSVVDGELDSDTISAVLSAAPARRATFHRAFDTLRDPLQAIARLKEHRQIDRVLTNGGAGSWSERRARLLLWQRLAGPEIRIIVAAGLSPEVLTDVKDEPALTELHVGRAARLPQLNSGIVHRNQVSTLKSVLA